MTVTIKGRVFGLSFDAAEDTAPEWTWTGQVPLCPNCITRGQVRPLLPHGREDTKLAPVTAISPYNQVVKCPSCDWQSEPLKS